MNNRVTGATFLVVGTTIGAGMLALPMASAGIDFWKTSALLVGMWAFMVLSACIMVEISQGKGRSIAYLAEQTLGKTGKNIASLSILGLFMALLAAYISGGSSIVHQEAGLPFWQSSFLFTVVLGGLVTLCTAVVDYANRALLIGKIAVFIEMMVGLFDVVDFSTLTAPVSYTHLTLPTKRIV